ncbi:uncharacterized protein LOC113557472 [Rhopalosiphum maidis]|uniref:uncharacterized protein LOC113557472 n=1 Tax=Rhopalosiphum maidis TaxID=43146 RepID=UPI000EFE57D9|nr:uncharacterized protein LOC113557472 [Rhopalosiphum maidis]
MIAIILTMVYVLHSAKSSICDIKYKIKNNDEVAIGEISFPLTANVDGTLSRKSEFANRRLYRDYRGSAIETYNHNQGGSRRRCARTPQVFVKKSVGVVGDKRRNVFFGNKEASIFDRYEGVFGHCDRRGKRILRN